MDLHARPRKSIRLPLQPSGSRATISLLEDNRQIEESNNELMQAMIQQKATVLKPMLSDNQRSMESVGK